MDQSTSDFSRHVLKEFEGLFEKGRIEVKIRLDREAMLSGKIDPAVMIIDTKTGEQITEERFPTQIQNKAVALLSLLKGKAIL